MVRAAVLALCVASCARYGWTESLLVVGSEPRGADVWVQPPDLGAEFLRGKTPCKVLISSAPVRGAVFKVRLERTGYAPYETQVLIHDGEQVDISGSMRRADGGAGERIVLAAVGDLCLGKVDDPFRNVGVFLQNADVTFGNLEGALTNATETSPAKPPSAVAAGQEYVFKAPPEDAGYLERAGFDVLALANNHAMDYRAQGLADTLAALRDHSITPVGAGPNLDAASAFRIVTVGRKTIGFLACSTITPSGFAATGKAAGVWAHPARAMQSDPLVDAVRRAAGTVNVLVVSLHWGIEREAEPQPYQRALARACVDAGADVVLGHHPHCLQPIELSGRKVVAYSLGNFVGLGTSDLTKTTLILRIAYDGEGLEWVEVTPVHIGDGLVPSVAGDPKRIYRRGM